MRIAINGFGRIGRLVARLCSEDKNCTVVAVNDLAPVDNLAYLLKYDTTHGTFPKKVETKGEELLIDGEAIRVFSEPNPALLPWKALDIDCVIEATGRFCDAEGASKHITAGARRVLVTAPAKSREIPTFVMGVNHTQYNPQEDVIVSNASCTTNCLAPVVKVLLDTFGIEEGLMTTVHAVTATQPTVDGFSKKDFRAGRGAGHNIIPASTGAAKAVGLCLPEIQGKLTGMAFRVPTLDVSVVDLTVRLSKSTSYEEICAAMKSASEGAMRGFLGYCDEPLVSSDFIGSHFSSIFDAEAGIALNDHFYKLVSWYDNEMGYACRTVDLANYMHAQSSKPANSKNELSQV